MESKSKTKTYLILGAILLIIIIIFAIPFPYQATKGHTEKIPYTVKEAVTTKLDFTVGTTRSVDYCVEKECLRYKSVCTDTNWLGNCLEYSPVCDSYKCTHNEIICKVFAENRDQTTGDITIELSKVVNSKKTPLATKKLTVRPGATTRTEFAFTIRNTDVGTCGYYVTKEPTKTSYENNIKYRNEYKEEPIILTDTLFKQWTGLAKYYVSG